MAAAPLGPVEHEGEEEVERGHGRGSSEVVDAARALLARQPGLDPSAAMRQVLQDDPALLARWHSGEAASEAAPTGDGSVLRTNPGAVLLASIGAKVAAGMDRPKAEAEKFAAYPALAAAYHRGELVRSPQGDATDYLI